MSPRPKLTLADVARKLDAAAPSADVELTGVNTLADAGPGDLAYLADAKFAADATKTNAAAVLVSEALRDADVNGRPTLVVQDAAVAIDLALDLFTPPHARPPVGVDAAARIAASATVGDDARVGPNVVVGERCAIGRDVTLHAGVVLGDDVTLGDGCELFAGVVVRDRCTLGHRVTVHANSVVGTDGFGYRFDGTQHRKIAHAGTVVVEDDVEIGSCTTIDRGKFAETRIGRGTKIDNLVQIAHNVKIGRLCIVCANVGIAGSTVVGDGVILAGGAGLKDHITVGAGSRIAAYTGVGNDVPPGSTLMGALYAMPQKQFLREQAAFRKLPELAKQVRQLEKRLRDLEDSTEGTAERQ